MSSPKGIRRCDLHLRQGHVDLWPWQRRVCAYAELQGFGMKQLLTIGVAAAVLMLMMPAAASEAVDNDSIFGTVTPLALAPEVEVCLVETRPTETCTTPNVTGTYTLKGLPAHVRIFIEFIPSYRSGFAIQYFDHADTLGEATPITLPMVPSQVPVDADLEVGGAIEGAVVAAGGPLLSEVEVCVLGASNRASYGCTETDEAGSYRLGSLPPGQYKVGFWGRNGSADYASQYYDGGAGPDQAVPISVTAGATVTGINATLTKGAKVTGTVIAAATRATLDGIPVCLFGATAPRPSQCVRTGPGGVYALAGIQPGDYQVGFSLTSAEIGGEAGLSENDGYVAQYYRGAAGRSGAQILALSGEGVTTDVDAALATPGPVAAPSVIVKPANPPFPRCKRHFVRKSFKGVRRCVRRAPPKKGRRRSRHFKATDRT